MNRHGRLMPGPGNADVAGMDQTSSSAGAGRPGYQNLILTLIAGVLALGAFERHAGPGLTGPANAQQPDQGGLVSAADQRKQIIAELRAMNSRLERVEAKLNSGLTVKVTDMPPLRLPPEVKPKADKGEGKGGVEVRPAESK